MKTIKRLATVALVIGCMVLDLTANVLNPVRQGELASEYESVLKGLVKKYSDEDTADSYRTMQAFYSR